MIPPLTAAACASALADGDVDSSAGGFAAESLLLGPASAWLEPTIGVMHGPIPLSGPLYKLLLLNRTGLGATAPLREA